MKTAIIKLHSGGNRMIELEQLIHLIAFYECKTLVGAAKQLHISQPVLTRSMQRLEEELEVSLFIRSKNKLTLNETGLMAVDLAKRIVSDADDMKKQIKDFDRKQHTFAMGSCAPAPILEMNKRVSQIYSQKTFSSEMKDMDVLIRGLKDKTYSIIIMPIPSDDDMMGSVPFMEEEIFFSLPLDHPFAGRKSLSMKEMDGQRMLLMSNIGFWHDIHKRKMPHTKFLVQKDRSEFFDLMELSSLPSFTSTYTLSHEKVPENRKIIPISDKEAKATFYCWYLKENKKNLVLLLDKLKAI